MSAQNAQGITRFPLTFSTLLANRPTAAATSGGNDYSTSRTFVSCVLLRKKISYDSFSYVYGAATMCGEGQDGWWVVAATTILVPWVYNRELLT